MLLSFLRRRFRVPGLIAAASATILTPSTAIADTLPPGFVHVADVIPGIHEDVRYFTSNNFIGEPIRGYDAARCILTYPAAQALAQVQTQAALFGLGLTLFDCYRPQRAVDHFVAWSKNLDDQRHKAEYYPDVAKDRLFVEGYIAERSGHSRGSTVDLTLVDLATGQPLDMGTPFDYFGPASAPGSTLVSAEARANRLALQQLMQGAGFKPLPEEWWHFTLIREPFPTTYFDFPVR